LVGGICAKISDWSSDQAWSKLFIPSLVNADVMKQAVDLSYSEKYDLMFLTMFKGIEAEAKRLLGPEYEKQKPEKIVSGLQSKGWLTESEFHMLNALRALRNEVGHGKPEEPSPEDRVFLDSEIKVSVLLAILLLMQLQSKGQMTRN
jgi:hypothetical protein